MKKTFKLPVTWEVHGFVNVEAKSLEEAVQDFNENVDEYELFDLEYVDGSFRLTENDIEVLKLICD